MGATDSFIQEGYATLILCIACPILAWVFSYIYYKQTSKIIVDPKVAYVTLIHYTLINISWTHVTIMHIQQNIYIIY